MLQITTVGDGAVTAWEKLTSTFVELSERELECGEDVVKLISNHFATIRHEDDIYRLVFFGLNQVYFPLFTQGNILNLSFIFC